MNAHVDRAVRTKPQPSKFAENRTGTPQLMAKILEPIMTLT